MDSQGEFRPIHHKTRANGVWLHHVVAGQGDPVLLLHGWPQTWFEWRRVMPALAERHTVHAPDVRGMGDSERPGDGYDAVTLAEDIYQLLRQQGALPAHLVGHDLGGPIAYALAAKHPEAARSLTIIECLLPGVGPLPSEIPGLGEPLWHFAFHSTRDLPEALITGRERMYLSYFYRHFAYDPSAIGDEDIDEYVRCYSAPGGLRASLEQYRALPSTAAAFAELSRKKLAVPVLALGGAHCLGEAVLNQARLVADHAEGGAVERSGHWVPEERPDFLAERLLSFFRQ